MPGRIRRFAVFPLIVLLILPPVESGPLRRLIERGRHPAIRWGRFPDVQPAALVLYRENGWEPLWLENGRASGRARELVDALATAGDRGLDPEDYDASQLGALRATMDRRGADQEQAVRFDAALTIAVLRFTAALARGRVGPKQPGPGFDGVGVVRALRKTGALDSTISALEPAGMPYRELKHALGRYRRFAKDSVRRRAFFEGRIARINLALERWRWLPRQETNRNLFLSGPAGRLELTDRSGNSTWFPAAIGEKCRRLPVHRGDSWMLVFRPAELPGAGLKLPFSDDAPLYGGAGAGPTRGCGMVGDAERLATLLLRERPDWSAERVRTSLSGTRQMFVRLPRTVTVAYVYATALVDQDGQVSFFDDAWGFDRKLRVALSRGYPY